MERDMRARIEAETAGTRFRAFIVEPEDADKNTPVLLFLHGRGEASPYLNEIAKVCFHLAPPLQATLGRLRGVSVVAPQVMARPEDDWNWRDHTKDLGAFLTARFGDRTLLATGFSRGGLGVLQLSRDHPDRVKKWAIIDPQRAIDGDEEKRLLPKAGCKDGWLRYGEGIPSSKPFGDGISQRLDPQNTRFKKGVGHAELALAAYTGDRLEGSKNLYEFLGLQFLPT
jgi:pimeloyl-ACP methyl ester carboxylesterase